MPEFAVICDNDASTDAVRDSLWRLVGQNSLCSMATVGEDEVRPHINTCFFAASNQLDLIVFTSPLSRHGRYLAAGSSVAISVFDSHQEWGGTIFGAQFFGAGGLCHGGEADEVLAVYASRHPRMSEWAKTAEDIEKKFESRMYRFRIAEFTLLDEQTFGKEGYVSGSIVRTT